MNLNELSEALKWLGHLSQANGDVEKALAAYQKFHGLAETGALDTETQRQLLLPRCGHPDVMAAMAGPCKWPMKKVTWNQDVQLSQLSPEKVQAIFTKAYQQWADVCGLQPVWVAHEKQANITSRQGSGRRDQLDGPSGVLAWSELPCGVQPNTQLQQVYDSAENWIESMLLAVACHEIGHALGLQHSTTGNLMAPYYDPRITKPQAGDISEMRSRYGPPTPIPTPTPTGTEIVVNGGLVAINGKNFVLTVTLTPRG
jgi:hypothetical protein